MPLLEPRTAGLYCAAGDFWIDPLRPVPRALITHAHADHARAGHGCVHAAAPGWPVLEHRLGALDGRPLDYGEPLRLGGARVSLHPAGHILGSAQVRIEAGGEVWLVSGDYKRQPDGTCAPFEVVPADVFVSEVTFGYPVYRWPEPTTVYAQIRDWWQDCAAAGETAVLLCYALGKAQRVLHGLHDSAEPILLHGAMTALTALYREAGVALAPTCPLSEYEGELAGRLVLAPPSAAGSPWMRRFRKRQLALASGWMMLRGPRRRRAVDRGFVLSDHADWPALLRTIEEVNPQQVLLTHGDSAPLLRYLREAGREAADLRGAR